MAQQRCLHAWLLHAADGSCLLLQQCCCLLAALHCCAIDPLGTTDLQRRWNYLFVSVRIFGIASFGRETKRIPTRLLTHESVTRCSCSSSVVLSSRAKQISSLRGLIIVVGDRRVARCSSAFPVMSVGKAYMPRFVRNSNAVKTHVRCPDATAYPRHIKYGWGVTRAGYTSPATV
jgi:hypothetical protein